MDILTGCTGSIAAEVVKCTAKPVIRHVGYLIRFKKTVDDLTKAKTDLQLEQQKVQKAIERAAMNNEIVEKDVERWLTNVNQLMEEVQALENKVQVNLRFCNGWCPDWIRQYKLGKEAMQKTNVVKELQDEGKFSELTHRAPTPGIEIFSSSDFEVFESRKLAFQQIMEAMHDDNSKRIGLHGIGGVGKTTLVKEVHKKTKKLNIFDEIVTTVVSLTPNVRRIQGEIAGCLNLKLDDESDMARASQICLRIKSVEKILIILDDVWKDVNLEAIGIPSCDDHRGCKMLLTTRSVHVCNLMRCQRKIPLNFLAEEESLALMKKTAIVDDCPGLNDVVLEVVKECKGLPIAIITVGKALTGKSLNDWNVAMHQLRKSRLVDIEGVDEDKNAYACLKWSFDQLKRKTKLCFLLCSLFPEDYNIPIEELTRYVMGLEEDEDFHLLEDARCQVRAAVNSLKDSSLLLEGPKKEFVKMHDMVRDIGLWITSKGENEFELRACTCLERNSNFERATAISLIDYNTKQLPDKLVCPRLKILLLGEIKSFEEISKTFFEGMNCLKVLTLHDIILSSQSLELLTNLRTLYLENCNFSDGLSSLGKLKRLEILSFYRCGMVALPSELGEMVSLKMLDLTNCSQLKQIPPNVIQRLSQLEELIIDNGFLNWDVEGTTSEISNANLSELNSLRRLVILSLELNSNHLPKGFVFPDLHRYFISIDCPVWTPVTPHDYYSLTCINSRTLEIKDLNASSMNALKSLFHTVEYIWMESCEMECIVDTIGGNHTATFGNLVTLFLKRMSCLRTICEGPNQYEIFSNLTDLAVSGCPRLISLFSPSLAQNLKKLKELTLDECDEMKQIISEEGMILESHRQPICLSNLETLEVGKCEKLEFIFPISVARGLQQLGRLDLRHLPRLKKVFGQNREGEVGDCEIESHHQPTGFPKLKTIEVVNCEILEYIFPILIARDLPQLESLSLEDLPQLKQVFGHEKGGDDGDGNNSVLSKLRNLRLENLPELDRLGGGNSSSVWPSLERLAVVNCPRVKKSFFANVEANVPALQKLQNLQILSLHDWNAISFDWIQGLSNLEELEIKNCGGIQEVIKLEGLLTIKGEQQDLLLPKLKKMLLIDLLKLRCIWNGTTKLINLNNLEDLKVIRCKKLTHLFTLALTQSLQKLKFLEIKRCDELEHLIVENVEEQVLSESHFQPLCFPKPDVVKVKVKSCNKLTCLFHVDRWNLVSIFLTMEELEIKNCGGLQDVFNFEGFLTREGEQQDEFFPKLRKMCLVQLHELTSIWKGPVQLINLNNLEDLKVIWCKKLTHIFTPILTQSLQKLKFLEIERCDQLENLIVENAEEQVLSESHPQPLCFPKPNVVKVEVKSCNKLKYLFHVDHWNPVSIFLTLEELELKNCGGLQEVFNFEGFLTKEGEQQVKFFPRLRKMWLIKLHKLTYIWKGPIQLTNFNNLEDLKVIWCKKLTHLFTPALAQSLQKLKFIEIKRCDELEHPIVENVEEQVFSESHLQPLCFPKPNVVKVKIKSCNKLKCLFHVDRWNQVSIFLTLEELEIKNCGGLQEVFNFEGFLMREGEQQDEFFPRLRKMCLVKLHELTYIWKGPIQLINLNNLEDLKVIWCKKLTHLFTPALAQSLQKLKFLEIERCDQLENLIVENAEEQVLSESHPQPLCFPKLNVVKVKVKSCNKLKCLIHVDHWNPISIFLTLEELELKNCGGLQEVFNFECFLIREGEQQDEFFPKLRKMCLVKLRELTYIWKSPIQLINFNNLKDLKVIGCKKLMHLFTLALAQSLQKLKFLEIKRCDELEHLIVENVEEQVSSESHLQPLCFLKLKKVNIRYCKKLKYLFPMAIADSLLELQVFLVKKNTQLMEVFTHEGDAEVQKDVTLPQLELMGLKGLQSLVNFCPKNYQFILPKWSELRVESCKNMQTTFTRTPNRSVLINGEVAQIDEPTGISTISPVLTMCPANNDITWRTDVKEDPTNFDYDEEFEWEDDDSQDDDLDST